MASGASLKVFGSYYKQTNKQMNISNILLISGFKLK